MGSDENPNSSNAGTLARWAALARPNHVALVDMELGAIRQRTYRELELRSEHIAAYIRSQSPAYGDRVILLMKNRIEYVEALLGVLKAGLVAVPIHSGAGQARIDAIIRDAKPSGLIALAPLDSINAKQQWKFVISSETNVPINFDSIATACPALSSTDVPSRPNDPAIILYTSGTTGHPKGVITTHRAAIYPVHRQFLSRPRYFDLRQRSILTLPVSHQLAFEALKTMLAYGGTTILSDKFRPHQFLGIIRDWKCTSTVIVPSVIETLCADAHSTAAINSIHTVTVGGAHCPPSSISKLQAIFPRARIAQVYGLTECGNVFVQRFRDGSPVPAESLGIPADGVEVRIGQTDQEDFGELYVRTPTLMSGYLNSGGPRVEHDWLATGDLFSRRDGVYFYAGRADEMFKCGGENVHPLEIERLLIEHPKIASAGVFSVPHATKGHVPCAAVCGRPGIPLDIGEILAYAKERLPRFISLIHIFEVAELPRSAIGKLDTTQLKSLFSIKMSEIQPSDV